MEVIDIIQVRLKDILKQKNMTLSELSKETGITMKTLSAFQNQKVESVQFNTIEQITYALDISVEDLIVKVVENYEIKVEFENIFNISDEEGIFIIKWINDNNIHTSPVSFKIFHTEFHDTKRVEFRIKSIDYTIPKNIFSMPELPYKYFNRNNSLINQHSYLELICYLLIQEYLFLSPYRYNINDEFIVNVHDIIETYSQTNIVKDEARYTDVGNVFSNNTYLYLIKTTALNNLLHLTSEEIQTDDKINANIESLYTFPFVSQIFIDSNNFKRKVFTTFD